MIVRHKNSCAHMAELVGEGDITANTQVPKDTLKPLRPLRCLLDPVRRLSRNRLLYAAERGVRPEPLKVYTTGFSNPVGLPLQRLAVIALDADKLEIGRENV